MEGSGDKKSSSKKDGKQANKAEKVATSMESPAANAIKIFASSASEENLKCLLVANYCKQEVALLPSDSLSSPTIALPAMQHHDINLFGANAICRYLARDLPPEESFTNVKIEEYFNIEEFLLAPKVAAALINNAGMKSTTSRTNLVKKYVNLTGMKSINSFITTVFVNEPLADIFLL